MELKKYGCKNVNCSKSFTLKHPFSFRKRSNCIMFYQPRRRDYFILDCRCRRLLYNLIPSRVQNITITIIRWKNRREKKSRKARKNRKDRPSQEDWNRAMTQQLGPCHGSCRCWRWWRRVPHRELNNSSGGGRVRLFILFSSSGLQFIKLLSSD